MIREVQGGRISVERDLDVHSRLPRAARDEGDDGRTQRCWEGGSAFRRKLRLELIHPRLEQPVFFPLASHDLQQYAHHCREYARCPQKASREQGHCSLSKGDNRPCNENRREEITSRDSGFRNDLARILLGTLNGVVLHVGTPESRGTGGASRQTEGSRSRRKAAADRLAAPLVGQRVG